MVTAESSLRHVADALRVYVRRTCVVESAVGVCLPGDLIDSIVLREMRQTLAA